MKASTLARPSAVATSGLICAVVLAATPTVGQQVERYQLTGSEVAVYNLAGEVTVQAGSGSAVVVEIAAMGRDADQLTIETGALGGVETLRVIYPDERIVYPEMGHRSRTEVRVRDDGTFGDRYGDRDRRDRGDRVRIEGEGSGLEAYADLTISVPRGQEIAVYLAAGRATIANVDGTIRMDTHSAPVTATGTRGSLVVDVGSGSVEVEDAEGDVNIDTGSGSVDVARVSGPRLLVDTGSGSVAAADVTVTTLEIDTGSGRIRAEPVNARDIRLDTGSGSVMLALADDAESIEIDTGSGDVTLYVPESFGAQVEIDTGSGGIELDMPLTMRRWERDHVTGSIGDGRARLVIDTGSGSVRVLKGR